MEENPLKRRRGRRSTIGSKTSDELLIESTFHDFDYRERAAALEREQEERLRLGAQDVESERDREQQRSSEGQGSPDTVEEGGSELITSCSKLSLHSELLVDGHAPDTADDEDEDGEDEDGDEDVDGRGKGRAGA